MKTQENVTILKEKAISGDQWWDDIVASMYTK
jgi:hypothetical protein